MEDEAQDSLEHNTLTHVCTRQEMAKRAMDVKRGNRDKGGRGRKTGPCDRLNRRAPSWLL